MTYDEYDFSERVQVLASIFRCDPRDIDDLETDIKNHPEQYYDDLDWDEEAGPQGVSVMTYSDPKFVDKLKKALHEPEWDTHDLGTGYDADDPKGWVVSGDYPDFDLARDIERGK